VEDVAQLERSDIIQAGAHRIRQSIIPYFLSRILAYCCATQFSAFPDDSVDRIAADMVPPTTDHYDFAPPPPLEMIPPLAADHMVHLLLSECTPSM
jgi:hypothetical protein